MNRPVKRAVSPKLGFRRRGVKLRGSIQVFVLFV
jgi:hypothetical protein